jgi:hypothetical protein
MQAAGMATPLPHTTAVPRPAGVNGSGCSLSQCAYYERTMECFHVPPTSTTLSSQNVGGNVGGVHHASAGAQAPNHHASAVAGVLPHRQDTHTASTTCAQAAALPNAHAQNACKQPAKRGRIKQELTAELAFAAASAEGLTLVRSNIISGFKDVYMDQRRNGGLVRFVARPGGCNAGGHSKGFHTAEEAALFVARSSSTPFVPARARCKSSRVAASAEAVPRPCPGGGIEEEEERLFFNCKKCDGKKATRAAACAGPCHGGEVAEAEEDVYEEEAAEEEGVETVEAIVAASAEPVPVETVEAIVAASAEPAPVQTVEAIVAASAEAAAVETVEAIPVDDIDQQRVSASNCIQKARERIAIIELKIQAAVRIGDDVLAAQLKQQLLDL